MKRILVAATALWFLAGLVVTNAQEKKPPADYVHYDSAPEMITQVQPEYPDGARKDALEGTVWVKVWIDESGKVVEAIIQKTDAAVFNQVAVAAAKQWTFKPAVLGGMPVAVWVSIPFHFKLSGAAITPKLPISSSSMSNRYPPAEDVKHDTEPELMNQVHPKYPVEATQAMLEGTVYTKMWVDETGHVVEVIVTKSDNQIFNQNSMDAGLQWAFKPALKNGKPIAVWVTVPFRFAFGAK